MFTNSVCNWITIINDALVTYNNRNFCTLKMTPVDALKKPVEVIYFVISSKTTTEQKFGDCVVNAHKPSDSSKRYTSNWNRELFKMKKVLETQPII